MRMRFADRREAGRLLGARLAGLGLERPVVVALPRGGVVVGAEVAAALHAPMEALCVRKIGHPQQPELGVGAIAEGGVSVVNERLARQLGLTEHALSDVIRREQVELQRRVRHYRGDRPMLPIAGRTVVVVDDGLATGYTAWAAVAALRDAGAGVIVLAVPVAPPDAVAELRAVADDVVCLERPADFMAVGEWYDDFRQVAGDEVAALLSGAWTEEPPRAARSSVLTRPVLIPAGQRRLPGSLTVPARASGVVLFAHGSGSSRLSPRNRVVARALERAGLGTLLFDLLTEGEAEDHSRVFDIALLAGRVADAVEWTRRDPATARLPIGLFGASTGAAAALVAAAELGDEVRAVVSRGGRPDLAAEWLGDVRCPTLLLVGGLDDEVLDCNRVAARQLHCEAELLVVPGATHLFEEPGTLEAVARNAAEWFTAAFEQVRSGR